MLANSSTLVLNRSWVAIATTSAQRALAMLYAGAARAVEPETYHVHDFESWSDLKVFEGQPIVKGVTFTMRLPEVIVLTRFDKVPRRQLVVNRRNLFRRDRNTCQYCGDQPGTKELTIDHIVPRSAGGETSWENCVLACVACNRRKRNRSLKESGMRLLRHPQQPAWTPTFSLTVARRHVSWEKFVSDQYWETPLR